MLILLSQIRVSIKILQEPLISTLRRATADSHARIEEALGLGGSFPIDWYRGVIRGFHQYMPAWEIRMKAVLPEEMQPWFAQRSRIGFLQQDMDALGLEVLSADATDPTFTTILPDTSAAFGSLYVMEGSALGGQVIARQCERQHGMGADTGAAYFHGYGSRTAAMWRDFQQVLETQDAQGIDHDAACAAAVQTFDTLSATLQRAVHEFVAP